MKYEIFWKEILMNYLEAYLTFCRKFRNYKLPKFKFKELNDWYRYLFKKEYDIDEDDINKASFVVSLFTFLISIFFSFFFTSFTILIIIFYSMIISLLVSYVFNTVLYRKINKEENLLNALLYLIIINFSLIKKTLKINSDYSLSLILLIKNYNLPISEKFKIILRKIHEGITPEDELLDIITPSQDFNYFLRDLVLNNYDMYYEFHNIDETASERNFRVILRDIETKISIIFFVGLFFPIGLCFLILFQQINSIIIILFVPFFLVFLSFLFRKLIRIDLLLIGFLEENSKLERKKFDEFLVFLKNFAITLRNNISPENAFIDAYLTNKNYFKVINKVLEPPISRLLNFSCSFGEMINCLKEELVSVRYSIILETIEKMLVESSYYSSEKIMEILKIIFKHRKLEKKLDVIIRGEKFKVLIFIFLLPMILGAIGGTLPLFMIITKNIENVESFSYYDLLELVNIFDFIIIFLTLFLSNLITCYYFLKIVNFEKRYLIIIISCLLFILSFAISFMNALTFF